MNDQLSRVKDIKNRSVDRGKRGVLQVIFGRTGILILCLLAEVLLLFFVIQYVAQYIYVYFGGHILFSFLMLLLIINHVEHPAFQLAWASLVLLFPIFGGLLYLYLQLQPGMHMLAARMEEIDQKAENVLLQDAETMREFSFENSRMAQLAYYVGQIQNYPIWQNTEVTYFSSGEEKYEELIRQLRNAKEYIFLEYFIIAEGCMWGQVQEILEQKVKEGVEVRLMYDGMNELNNLPHDFCKKMKNLGIRCKVFSKVYPAISTSYNNRDHRKIVVIDGHTAFTGGVNLADEYINQKERFGHWKDAGIMLRGEAAKSFVVMFLKMWDTTENLENFAVYLRESPAEYKKGTGFVMPYAANPLKETKTAERIYLEILNSATRYVHIMTPYLVPDHEMMQALIYAARRGVDVKLILPHIPDKKYAFALAHSYYKNLVGNGVRIYEYTPGFIHSKVVVSDDICGVVGSINLDYRSLYLNFECAVYLYDVPELRKVEEDFRKTLIECQLVTAFDIRHDKITRKLSGHVLKLLAPLM
ncbi:MAG: cardiolipin synthase [Clostridiales bacterium]|nr:cardiolipin synthase [Clostridiales bacterium]